MITTKNCLILGFTIVVSILIANAFIEESRRQSKSSADFQKFKEKYGIEEKRPPLTDAEVLELEKNQKKDSAFCEFKGCWSQIAGNKDGKFLCYKHLNFDTPQ